MGHQRRLLLATGRRESMWNMHRGAVTGTITAQVLTDTWEASELNKGRVERVDDTVLVVAVVPSV